MSQPPRIVGAAALAILGLALSGCRSDGPDTGDSLTGWLEICTRDEPSGSPFECVCGLRTRGCDTDADCAQFDPDAICAASSDEPLAGRCDGDAPERICSLPCDAGTCDDARPHLQCAESLCLPCAPGLCQHGGSCSADGQACRCAVGVSGRQCESEAGVRSLALGLDHACALLSGNRVRCWGDNTVGQLGRGDTAPVGTLPDEVASLIDVDLGETGWIVELRAGAQHTCARFDDGRLKCWGANDDGQLGLGDVEARGDEGGEMSSALPFVDLGGWARAVATGTEHTCALLTDGLVKCWGNGFDGALGQGDTESLGDAPSEVPRAIASIALGEGRRAVDISASFRFSCALLDDASIKCWGTNTRGELGQGDLDARGDEPGEMGDALAAIVLPSAPVAILAGLGSHSRASLADGSIRCWGLNSDGHLGIGDADNRGDEAGEMGAALPSLDVGGEIVELSVGGDHSCARLNSGDIKCFGRGLFGATGQGDGGNVGDDATELGALMPILPLPPVTVRSLASGGLFSCAITTDDEVYCWGQNDLGQLGLGDTNARGDEPEEMGVALPRVPITL